MVHRHLWYKLVMLFNHLLSYCTPNSNSSKPLLSPFQLADPSITVTDHSPPPSAPHIPVHSLTTSHFLSQHNSPQAGRKLSCRPRYISMLSITATLSISNQNLLFFLLLAPSYHQPAISDCPAKVWMIDRLSFHHVNFCLMYWTLSKKNAFQICF